MGEEDCWNLLALEQLMTWWAYLVGSLEHIEAQYGSISKLHPYHHKC